MARRADRLGGDLRPMAAPSSSQMPLRSRLSAKLACRVTGWTPGVTLLSVFQSPTLVCLWKYPSACLGKLASAHDVLLGNQTMLVSSGKAGFNGTTVLGAALRLSCPQGLSVVRGFPHLSGAAGHALVCCEVLTHVHPGGFSTGTGRGKGTGKSAPSSLSILMG